MSREDYDDQREEQKAAREEARERGREINSLPPPGFTPPDPPMPPGAPDGAQEPGSTDDTPRDRIVRHHED